MAATSESNRNLEFLLIEANGTLSREQITVVSGAGALGAGTVLGKITASGKYTAYDDDNVDGSETAAAILLYDADATSADVEAAVIVRDAEVKADKIVWAATNDATDITNGTADLVALNIIIR